MTALGQSIRAVVLRDFYRWPKPMESIDTISLKVITRNYLEYDQNRSLLKIGEEFFYENIQEANFSFVYPTKPANYFHVLRRQMKRNFRKPVIIAGPKTLLRHPKCTSKFEDLSETTHFKRILHYTNPELIKSARNFIICSGKYVYDI